VWTIHQKQACYQRIFVHSMMTGDHHNGSWLDMAESELGVLSSQCLDRRIPDKQTLIDEIALWEDDRNVNHAKADWQFTTADARIKLKYLYPSI
jgi:hypothetical protein